VQAGLQTWLHEHAVEVQALAAVVQALAAGVTVVLTAALVWATRRYVGLTADLAKAASSARPTDAGFS
jgi:hypothetical protein